MKLKTIINLGPAFVLFTTLFTVWEIFVQTSQISNQLLPSPIVIMQAFFRNWNIILPHVQQTLIETLIGIFTAIVIGITTAVLLDTSSWVKRAVYPILVTSQTIPIIALAPLLLIWLGFDIWSKVVVVTLFCYFPITIAMSDGFSRIDKEFINLFKTMNASYIDTMRLLKFPSALPAFFSGLKIAVTYSITGAMVGEYVGAEKGLGVFIQTAANAYAISLVFATIFVTTLLSMLLFILVSILEKMLLPWKEK
ncbi:MAG: ABC transporter permease [Candidatus Levyibacteriota bacterium]|nr:MAG: ABC transporter permease [Candidatus Levybacteria bacterium]